MRCHTVMQLMGLLGALFFRKSCSLHNPTHMLGATVGVGSPRRAPGVVLGCIGAWTDIIMLCGPSVAADNLPSY